MSRFRSSRNLLASAAVACALAIAAPVAAQPDAWVTTKVKMALLTSDEVDGLDIRVDTVDGRVTLFGKADAAAERERAEKIALTIDGVRDVRNLIQVVEPAIAERVEVEDERLAERVHEALSRSPELSDSDIEVKSVSDGVVLLSGNAATLQDHLRALEIAHGVEGVKHVASEVKSPDRVADAELWHDGRLDARVESTAAGAAATIQDLWITSYAKMKLMANADVPALDVNVDTVAGHVTLFGMVPTNAARERAELEIRSIGGVKGVSNELEVVPEARRETVQATDGEIEERIAQRLQQRETLRDADVNVEVAAGVARLTGTVQSQADRLTALTLTRGTEGVKSAVDDLRVESTPAVSTSPDRD